MRPGICATGSTQSTMPVPCAVRGMPECSASSGSCAMVRPPRSLTRLRPIAPSPSAPGEHHRRGVRPVRVRQRAEEIVHRHAGTAVLRQIGQPQVAIDRREVFAGRDHIDVVRLDGLRRPWPGRRAWWSCAAASRPACFRAPAERCRITTKAIPLAGGMALKIPAAPRYSPPSRPAPPAEAGRSHGSARRCPGGLPAPAPQNRVLTGGRPLPGSASGAGMTGASRLRHTRL